VLALRDVAAGWPQRVENLESIARILELVARKQRASAAARRGGGGACAAPGARERPGRRLGGRQPFGLPASKRAFAGSVFTFVVPVGSTQGHGLDPKNAGFCPR
jgi:hypothetical protein